MRGPCRLHSCAPQIEKQLKACAKSVKNVARGDFCEVVYRFHQLIGTEPVEGTFAIVLDGLSSAQELVPPLPYPHLRLLLHRLMILCQR